jgi:Formyl transferase
MSDAPALRSVRPRIVLVCHAESRLNREAVACWLASFSDLVGLVLIEERGRRAKSRIRNELRRIGYVRFLDVVAFRVFYAVWLARRDRRWLAEELDRLKRRFPELPSSVQVLRTPDPNTAEVRRFLEGLQPDIMVARCKRLLKADIFGIPTAGTFVLHPGVCPEYRNAHGAFWALAERDLERVGLTLLKIDHGVDTGPIYGYFSYDYDEVAESHIVLMSRLLLENLDAIRDRLLQIWRGNASPIDTTGRRSAVWGQPWLTRYLRWKHDARQRRKNEGVVARIS